MKNTFTIATRNPNNFGPAYLPADGIPRNLSRDQAESLANKARFNGVDALAFNTQSL